MAGLWKRSDLSSPKSREEISLHEVKVTLVCQQLRRGHMLDCDCVVRGVCDDGIAAGVLAGPCHQGADAREDRFC